METIYWTTKNGTKIDIDKMTIEHLKNTLKMIVKQSYQHSPRNIDDIDDFDSHCFDPHWDLD